MILWKEILSSDSDTLIVEAQRLKIHPLALEDCIHQNQRPKLEDFESHQLLVWFLMAGEKIYELQFLIFPDLILLVTHDPAPSGGSWEVFLKISSAHKDVWHLLYQALDKSTDVTWHELNNLFNQIDKFEDEMFDREINPRSLLALKKQFNQIDYSIGHLASLSKQIENFSKPQDDLIWKFRDLHDHCERIARSAALYRSQVATTIELYWGLQGNKTNAQIKKLSLLASVAVPLTFWASFWGMNFEAIPFNNFYFFLLALGIMGLSVLGAVVLLIKQGYWKD